MKVLKRKEILEYKEERYRKRGTFCPVTWIPLTKLNAVLDHDHTTGYIRDVVERSFNQFMGKTETNYKRFLGYKKDIPTLPAILRTMAEYIERDWSKNPLHQGWVDLQIRKFGRMNKSAQTEILNTCYRSLDIRVGKTSKERVKQYKEYMYEK